MYKKIYSVSENKNENVGIIVNGSDAIRGKILRSLHG